MKLQYSHDSDLLLSVPKSGMPSRAHQRTKNQKLFSFFDAGEYQILESSVSPVAHQSFSTNYQK